MANLPCINSVYIRLKCFSLDAVLLPVHGFVFFIVIVKVHVDQLFVFSYPPFLFFVDKCQALNERRAWKGNFTFTTCMLHAAFLWESTYSVLTYLTYSTVNNLLYFIFLPNTVLPKFEVTITPPSFVAYTDHKDITVTICAQWVKIIKLLCNLLNKDCFL